MISKKLRRLSENFPALMTYGMVGLCAFHTFNPILGVELCKKVTKLDMEPLLEEPWAKRSSMYILLKKLHERGVPIYDQNVMYCQSTDPRFKPPAHAPWRMDIELDPFFGVFTNQDEKRGALFYKIRDLRNPQEIVAIVNSGQMDIMQNYGQKLKEIRIRNTRGLEIKVRLPVATDYDLYGEYTQIAKK
ncbi:MAG: hypothetical protein AABX38_00490 [Candidatus Micrarchaeota archaeon]